MNDEHKTKEQLIIELAELRRRISELETSEVERKWAEDLFNALSISSPVGIYIVQDGKFKLGNPRFQILTGYSEDELSSMDPLMLVFPEDRDMVRDNAAKMLKGERSSPYEYRVVGKDGKLRWIMETATSIKYHGRQAA
jgi:PAS domain S-box-containing protein